MNEDHRGTIFIVDISGYSKFVAETENEAGSLIICALLESIIEANRLSFNISEIEGDAILFYRHGPAFPVKDILAQFEIMLQAFKNKLETFKDNFPQTSALSIKLVVHYGVIGRFAVGSYSKLFGQAVVEAHRLLKNSIGTHTYALITKDYYQQDQDDFILPAEAKDICELYDVGRLCYTYFAYPFDAGPLSYLQSFRLGQTGT
ncbi:Protein of unknown function [Mucilaginibacter gossypiicola]|uniref:Adenylate cyclase, class 3 n=1 Tax=Mucilaginibacter gossypiicola TaxID=551995 RepID=A0A1H8BDG2_9SPHI|nr:DUF2652 domain-containing protein [Mucilaginibacter gossypiicola]SEM79877.1 Protein of unknown function [Mucilaginibacter gossypiicola]